MQPGIIRGILGGVVLVSSLEVGQPGLAQSAVEYRQRGLHYRETGQMTEAIESLQKAVALEPEHLEGRVALGWTLHLAGDDRQSAEVLQATLWLNPFHVQTLNALGIVYLVNEDLSGAVLVHSWAAWLKPDNEIAYYNLSLAFQRSNHYDWAIINAAKAAELEPDNPHPLVALAIAEWSNGDSEKAQQAYQQAIELDTRYTENAFLFDDLDQAGFNLQQIDTAKQILASL